jgi:hypothetical protein
MKPDQTVTRDYFVKRVAELCLRSGMSSFPKDDLDRHILYKSAVLAFAADAVFAEREVTARLETWVRDVSQIKNIDGVTVRRYLIDAGYLTRSKDGTQYRVARPGPQPPFYDESIDSVDVLEVIESARAEIERRKQAYLKKTQE